jgi:hypothetical protein
MRTLPHGGSRRVRYLLEAVSLAHPRDLGALLGDAAGGIAANDQDIIEIAPSGEITGKLPQRSVQVIERQPRPDDGCALFRHDRDVFVPYMQVDDAIARAPSCSVRKRYVALKTTDLYTEDTASVARILDERLSAAQPAVEAQDEAPDRRSVALRRAGLGDRVHRRLTQRMNMRSADGPLSVMWTRAVRHFASILPGKRRFVTPASAARHRVPATYAFRAFPRAVG